MVHLKGLHLGLVFHRTSSLGWINIPASLLRPSHWWLCLYLDRYIASVCACVSVHVCLTWEGRAESTLHRINIDTNQSKGPIDQWAVLLYMLGWTVRWMWALHSEPGLRWSDRRLKTPRWQGLSTGFCGWPGVTVLTGVLSEGGG